MRRGDLVWPCYDAKMARAVPGVVVKTKQRRVLVRFKPWASDDNKVIEVWFSKRPETFDSEWSKLKTNRTTLGYGPRYIYSGWATTDETMKFFVHGARGTYYRLRTEKQMTVHGNPSFKDSMKDEIAELKATL